MLADELPRQIELLVDNLRKNRTSSLSLTDVASVTEVLIGTMNAFFRSIDTSIYRECRALSEYIQNARVEIASLQPGDLENSRIPRAGLELDAIVQHTEEATNTIMSAAEEIMALDTSDMDAYQNTVNDAVMRIFEACSFQDITGQRISKVVETLAHIEQRVMELRGLLGVTEDDVKRVVEPEETGDKGLLHGPALRGEGIDQSAVDALMSPTAAAPAAEPEPAPAPAPKPAAAKPAAPKPEPPKPVPPRQLDKMFEEDFDPVADLAAKEEAKKAEEEKKAAAAAATVAAATAAAAASDEEEEIDLPAGEEVSQDDIDALFS
ncbi:protein phosphatase CheZ [Gimibacter soli]|uniref:Protein phosphatase CheZ n=1 Tax=Gimibacter soli TaxID=3024400 RepID=A0AAE9XPW3_9PROT|nr:protein phosphatase CheZ [Gimibacter soli]WCL55002.1 protein phosphatase CheZ [Gimibacter soli]